MDSIISDRTKDHNELLRISAQIDDFEAYKSPHGKRIASMSDALAQAFNLASRDRFFLQQAALLHDIGEMIMGREYIQFSGGLTATERIDLQRHPVIGEQEMAKLGLPRGSQLIVRWHHEWWNGTGYPDNLESEQIPLAARILRVADTYAALTASRPYRSPLTAEDAMKYLVEWAGIEFDPTVVKAVLAIAKQPQQEPVSIEGTLAI